MRQIGIDLTWPLGQRGQISRRTIQKCVFEVEAADKEASQESAAVIGFSSAFGAYGAFIWPRLFGTSLHDWGSVRGAMWITLGVYVSGLAVCWWFYYRKGAEAPA